MKKVLTILALGVLSFQFAKAQEITTHQYRRVAPENVQEYLKRETTYWSKFAESEIKKGNLTFWAILQRVGGTNMETAPNILIVNTFKDLDKSADWGSVADLFPGVTMEDIQTNTLSTTTDMIFLRDQGNHIQAEGVDPEKEFNFVRIIYHNTKSPSQHLNFEAEKWKAQVSKAMSEDKTSIKGWGNSVIISPVSGKFPYNSSSYDLFSSSHAALSPSFSEDWSMPDGFWDGFEDNYAEPARNSNLYRIVAVRSADQEMASNE